MVKLFYSYHDGNVYMLHEHCTLELLMEEHTGGDGLLIYACKGVFEIVEYIDSIESGFTTRVTPKVRKSASDSMCESASDSMCEMESCVNKFFDFVDRMTEKKC